jgi:capsule biosynthesis phosphatase
MRSIVRRPQTAELFELSLVVDLDHTLCVGDLTIESSVERYANAKPINETIEKLREAHSNGWYITILTARHMRSCHNDVELAFTKLSQITADWLDQHNVPFDQLVFGKPYGMWYIDDKAMTLDTFLYDFYP